MSVIAPERASCTGRVERQLAPESCERIVR
jgi:hypothetical protein